MIKDILDFGNSLQVGGIIYLNGNTNRVIMFPDVQDTKLNEPEYPSYEEWKELLSQLDTLGVEGLDKVILRKSQRQIEQNVSWNVFHRDGYRCRYCNKGEGEPMTVDHVVLWEHMGASEENNLITACRKCNKTRGSMLYPDWLETSYYTNVLHRGFSNSSFSTVNMVRVDEAHDKNMKAWDIAKTLPLRNSKRSR